MIKRPADWPPARYDFELAQHMRDIGAGVRKLPESTAKRHHFVPQFVLRGFAHGEQLFQLDQKTGRTFKSSPRDAAQARRLYSVEDEAGVHDNRIEAYLGLVEHYAAPTLEDLRNGKPTTEEGAFNLSFFFAMQIARTPQQLEALGQMYHRVMEEALKVASADAQEWRRFLSSPLAQRFDAFEGETAEEQRLRVRAALAAGITPEFGGEMRYLGMDIMIGASIENAAMFTNADWLIVRTPSAGLITNDRCLFRVLAGDGLPWEDCWGFPLAPELCVLVRLRKYDLDGLRVAGTTVDEAVRDRLNLRIYGWAQRYIYAESQHAAQSTRAAAKRHPHRGRKPTANEFNDRMFG